MRLFILLFALLMVACSSTPQFEVKSADSVEFKPADKSPLPRKVFKSHTWEVSVDDVGWVKYESPGYVLSLVNMYRRMGVYLKKDTYKGTLSTYVLELEEEFASREVEVQKNSFVFPNYAGTKLTIDAGRNKVWIWATSHNGYIYTLTCGTSASRADENESDCEDIAFHFRLLKD